MKALILAAALALAPLSAHAECDTYYNAKNHNVYLTLANGGATVITPEFVKNFDTMTGGTDASGFGLYPRGDEGSNEFYAVFFDANSDKVLTSPDLAKIVHGSPIFRKECK